MDFLPEIFTGVAATAWFAKSSNDKKNSLTYITDERRKWRTEIRLRTEKIVEIVEKLEKDSADSENLIELKKSRAFFEIRLNPIDKEDQAILQTLKDIADGQYDKLEEFQDRIARLLKHDWERSKTEVNNKGKIFFIIMSLVFTAIVCALSNEIPIGDSIGWKIVEVLRKKYVLLLTSLFLDSVSVYYSLQLILNFLIPRCCNNPVATEASSKFFKLFSIHLRILKEQDIDKTKEKECCVAKFFSFLIAFVIIFVFLLYLVVLVYSLNLCQTMSCCIITILGTTAVIATTITICILCKICHNKTSDKAKIDSQKESNKQENPKSKSSD
ncbi:hypothetical protein J6W78_05540 [bacterium]|nr:hypothetical protein [bacterium]